MGKILVAAMIAAPLAVTPARADDGDRMIAAFDCAMIAKYATTEKDSLRLFEIGKSAGIKDFQKQTDLFVDLPHEQAIYFSLGSWWAARAQLTVNAAMKQGRGEFGEGFNLNSSDGILLMKGQYQLRNCGLIGEAGSGPGRASGDLIEGPPVVRLPKPAAAPKS